MPLRMPRGLVTSTWITVVLVMRVLTDPTCPDVCKCVPRERSLKVTCQADLADWAQIGPGLLPPETTYLDISGNQLTSVPSGVFQGLSALTRLDLQSNQIAVIELDAFSGLDSLNRLNLSGNHLSQLNVTSFEGIPKLSRLSLSDNALTGLPDGIFSNTPMLARIDLSTPNLRCDCDLLWMLSWMKAASARISNTECASPVELVGKQLRKLKQKDFDCGEPTDDGPTMLMSPSVTQVVFEGDTLPLTCTVKDAGSEVELLWRHKDMMFSANGTAENISVATEMDDQEVVSILTIEELKLSHAGMWKCVAHAPSVDLYHSVTLLVISPSVIFCPPITTSTNRGNYSWPQTVSKKTITQPCSAGPSSGYHGRNKPEASHKCTRQGHWDNLDVGQCQFSSEITRRLEEFAMADLANVSRLASKAEQLYNYLNSGGGFEDYMDVKFMAQILEKLSKQLSNKNKLSSLVSRFTSLLMDAEAAVLAKAQQQHNACSRVTRVVEQLPHLLFSSGQQTVTVISGNLMVQAYRVRPGAFPGLSCVTRTDDGQKYADDSLMCSLFANYTPTSHHQQALEWDAFIHIPGAILNNVRCPGQACPKDASYELQVIVYRNAKLFPIFTERDGRLRLQAEFEVTTNVISSQIVGVTVNNLTEPIEISLSGSKSPAPKTPVYWETSAFDDIGTWSSEGCWLIREVEGLVTFRCNHMTQYAVLQAVLAGAGSKFLGQWWWLALSLHPAMYAGCTVLFLACLIVVVIYLAGLRQLQMPLKMRHSIANLCLSLLLLSMCLSLAVQLTMFPQVCQVAGLTLHYLSICALFWMAINAYNHYRKLSRRERLAAQPQEPIDGPPPPKPLLRFYLIGWGIALIICGITAAVDITFYAGGKPYCFLSWEPWLGAFLVPVCLLLVIIFVFYLRAYCTLRSAQYLLPSDEPETEEINEQDLTHQEIESLPQDPDGISVASSSMITDREFRPVTQLRAHVVILVLYILAWTTAAFAIARPFAKHIPFHDIIFPYAFALFAGALGIFILLFYGIGRSDARAICCKVCCCCCCCCRRPHKEAQYSLNGAPPGMFSEMNGHAIQQSQSSLASDFTSKSTNTNRSSQPRSNNKKHSYPNLLPPPTDPSIISSIHDQVPQNFYNPRQNGVAKKYWQKKQHRHNNMRLLKTSDGGMSDRSNRSHASGSTGFGGPADGSDHNTHLSFEIQVQSPPRTNAHGFEVGPLSLDYMKGSLDYSSPYSLPQHTPLLPMVPLDPLQISPGAGLSSPATSSHGGGGPMAWHGSHRNVVTIEPLPRAYSEAHSALMAQPAPYSSLPRNLSQHHSSSGSLPRDATQPAMGRLSRPRSTDVVGSDKVGLNGAIPGRGTDAAGLSPLNMELQSIEKYKPPEPPVVDVLKPRSCTPDSETRELPSDGENTIEKPSSAHSTGSRKHRKQAGSFMDQLEQRIPRSKSPGQTRSNPSSREQTLSRVHEANDNLQHGSLDNGNSDVSSSENPTSTDTRNSDNHSNLTPDNNSPAKPTDSSETPPATDSTKPPIPSRSSRPKRSPCKNDRKRAWDDEYGDRPAKPCYAYINRTYEEKVLSKLLQQVGSKGGNGSQTSLPQSLNWFPRSVSAYEAVASDAAEHPSDSSDDSSDGSEQDIWVPRRKKNHFKKETSV